MKKIYAISDNAQTCIGLGLAEVSSSLAKSPEDLQQILANIDHAESSIVIITEGLAQKSAEILAGFRAKNNLPLITIIPDPQESPK